MTKTLVISVLALAAAGVSAQEVGRVLSSTPVVQQVAVPRQVCNTVPVAVAPQKSGAGAVLGAIAGGAVGNSVGGGSGRAAATVLGVLGGAMLGDNIEGGGVQQVQNMQQCGTQTVYENRSVGYNVVYEYAGRQYTTRTQNDPGRWIPLSVQPTGQTYSTQPDPYAQQGVYSQPGVVTSTYPVQPVYQQPTYVTPPVTVIEYGYDRPYYPHHRNPYWR